MAHSSVDNLREAGIGVVEEVIEVGQQVELQSSLTAFQRKRVHAQKSHDNEQRRHHNLGNALNALLHAHGTHTKTNNGNQKHPTRELHRVTEHQPEHHRDIFRAVKCAHRRLHKVGDGPTAYHGIEHHKQIAANQTKPLEAMPLRTLRLQSLVATR